MFVRASTLVLAIAASAIAAPGSTTTPTVSQCDAGTMQCCDSTESPSDAANILSSLGIDIPLQLQGLVGFGCVPITVIGTGSGATCTQQPVCCSNVKQNGLVNVGCSPLNLGL